MVSGLSDTSEVCSASYSAQATVGVEWQGAGGATPCRLQWTRCCSQGCPSPANGRSNVASAGGVGEQQRRPSVAPLPPMSARNSIPRTIRFRCFCFFWSRGSDLGCGARRPEFRSLIMKDSLSIPEIQGNQGSGRSPDHNYAAASRMCNGGPAQPRKSPRYVEGRAMCRATWRVTTGGRGGGKQGRVGADYSSE